MSLIEMHSYEGRTIGRLTVPDGPWSGQQLGMLFYSCDNAACKCTDVTVALVDTEEASLKAKFTVDVAAKKRSQVDQREKDCAIIDAIIARFDVDDWNSLWEIFSSVKLEMTENLNYELTHAEFPMSSDIEANGELVPYNQILPYGKKFILGEPNDCVFLDEQYCLKSGCDCDGVVVAFVHIENGIQKPGEAPHLRIQYRSGKIENIREAKSGDKLTRDLWNEFKVVEPNILEIFKKRHEQIAKLYKSYKVENHPQAATVIEGNRVGRNDPCPCGSGKKFKKCCL